MYKNRPDWPIEYFYNEVVNACSAVFLHKFYSHSDLIQILGKGEYLYDYPSPLGFLLYVCDTMCEWSRKDKKQEQFFHVRSENDSVLFDINLRFKNHMNDEIKIFDQRVPIQVNWTP